jgi:hypothetical protein
MFGFIQNKLMYPLFAWGMTVCKEALHSFPQYNQANARTVF